MDRTRRRILDRLLAGAVSGPTLAAELAVSRAAVWKHVEALREDGFEIASTPSGYELRSIPEYGEAAVAAGLPGTYDVIYEETMASTNDVARELATSGANEAIVLANEQPTGRGRLGRSWSGPPGGIYCSILCHPELSPVAVPVLTTVAGVAVAEALADLGLDPSIKWPNDVLLDGSKVAGILTEMEGEADQVHWAIVGIGINANVDAAALPAGATSLQTTRGEPVVRREVVQAVIRSFDRYRDHPTDAIDELRAWSATIGRRVRVDTQTGTVTGLAVDVVRPGSLVVQTDEGTEHVHAGDCEHLRAVDGT